MPIEYQSLKDHVYDYIANLIASGRDVPDSGKITEQQVCDALGVSRTPVREALIQLAADGYLNYLPRRGFFVSRLTEERAVEIIEILGPLDGRAALLAVDRMSDEEIAQLRLLHESIASAMEQKSAAEHNRLQHEFHGYYLMRCGNQKLIDMVRHLNWYFMKRETINPIERGMLAVLQQSVEEHERIVQLFEARQGQELQRYVRDVHWNVENARSLAW